MESRNNWMPDDTVTTYTYRWWFWVLLGIVVVIVFIGTYESLDTPWSQLNAHYDRIDIMYREGRLFGYAPIQYTEQTSSVCSERD
jgi:hypothetical protein